MNQAAYMAVLKPGDTVMAMDLSHGGHLTHGAPVSHMGQLYNFVRYKSDPEDGHVDFDHLVEVAKQNKSKLVLCGYTSYPRDYDYAGFMRVADSVGAITMADVSHVGGLIAGGAMRNPFDDGFDIVTTTTHKSLRGPRGGMILCKKKFASAIDKSVFPGLQGGPHMNVIAGIAVALGKAQRPEFRDYAKQVLLNSKALANALMGHGAVLVTGGTSNHMMVMNTVKSFGIDGKVAEKVLEWVSITTNKQVIPDDPNGALRPSGIRLGTPAATTRGMKEEQMQEAAFCIIEALRNPNRQSYLAMLRQRVQRFCYPFVVPQQNDETA